MNPGRDQLIELRVNRAEDMFALAQTDLFSEYRFSPLEYGRENRALQYLHDAEISVTSRQPATP